MDTRLPVELEATRVLPVEMEEDEEEDEKKEGNCIVALLSQRPSLCGVYCSAP